MAIRTIAYLCQLTLVLIDSTIKSGTLERIHVFVKTGVSTQCRWLRKTSSQQDIARLYVPSTVRTFLDTVNDRLLSCSSTSSDLSPIGNV